MRVSHYLRHNQSSETLNELIVVDTETRPYLDVDGAERHRLWFGWAAYVRRIRGREWSRPHWFRFDTADDFWKWVQLRTRPKVKLYLVAHNWGFDALVLSLFDELPRRRWKMLNACIDCPPVIIRFRRRDRTIIVLDSLNWWRDSLRNLEPAAGLSKLRMPAPDAPSYRWDAYCRRDVRVVLRLITRWADFLRDNDLGSFAPTLASQAFRTYRHRFMDHKILIDAHPSALAMARDAYMGGRVECFRIGRIDESIYILDVNSTYLSVMRDNFCPTKLVSVQRICTPAELRGLMAQFCIVAECDAMTEVPCVPIRQDGALVFPVGRLRGTWTTPELRLLMECGKITKVHRVAIYERAPMFKRFSNEVWKQRMAAIRAGDSVRSHQWKTVGNSLYGKFGQRGTHWEDVEHVKAQEVKVWEEYDADDKRWRYFRQIGGVVQTKVEHGEARDSHPAVAAHITAYARVVLWRFILRAGRSNVVYCDTDSIWCSRAGYRRLAIQVDPHRLGALKHESTEKWIVLNGPKDYVKSGSRKIKGIRKDAIEIERGLYIQAHWRGMAGAIRDGDLSAPKITGQVKHLSRRYRKGIVTNSGGVLPFRLAHW